MSMQRFSPAGTSSDPLLLDRIPPQNLDAEKSVLGAMLIEPEAIGRAVEFLKGDAFYQDSHRRIFEAIVLLYERNHAADLITLCEELTRQNQLDAVGGAAYVQELLEGVPTAANVEYYAKIVREKSLLRQLISSCSRIASQAYEASGPAEEVLDTAERQIFDISQRRVGRGFAPLKELIHSSIEQVEKLYHRKSHITGVGTGFTELDEMTSGFHPGDLVIIAARPGMGKTSLALSIAQHVAIRERGGVAIFSLEMPTEQVVLRLLCSEARVDLHRVRSGRLFDADWAHLTIAAGLLAEAPIYIDDSVPMTVLEMKSKIRRLYTELKSDLKLIMVDYMQMMTGRSRSENRQQEIAEISRSLKAIAKELRVPMVVLSQLSRAPERRTDDARPQLADLRESGAIEQDADLVAFIYREAYYNRESEKQSEAELIIAKQRNGPTGMIKLAFVKEITRFENLALHPPVAAGEEV